MTFSPQFPFYPLASLDSCENTWREPKWRDHLITTSFSYSSTECTFSHIGCIPKPPEPDSVSLSLAIPSSLSVSFNFTFLLLSFPLRNIEKRSKIKIVLPADYLCCFLNEKIWFVCIRRFFLVVSKWVHRGNQTPPGSFIHVETKRRGEKNKFRGLLVD